MLVKMRTRKHTGMTPIPGRVTGPEAVIYSHSLKLEETAKELRISVYVYSNNQEQSIEEAFSTYLMANMTAIDNKIPISTYRKIYLFFYLQKVKSTY